MRRFLSFFCPLLILTVLSVGYFGTAFGVRSDVRLLLPVSVVETGRDAFSSFVRLRYHNFIPVQNLSVKRGAVVVERREDGRAAFVSDVKGKALRTKELLLKYVIAPSSVFNAKTSGVDILFATGVFRFNEMKTFPETAVRYALVSVDASGKAVLTGLTDGNGDVLVRGIAPVLFRTP